MAFLLVPALLVARLVRRPQTTSQPRKRARRRAARRRRRAAAAYADQESKVAATQNHIDELRDVIEKQKARAVLKDIATQQRALYAYTHQGDEVDMLVGSDNTVKAIRQTQLLQQANQTDANAVRKLAAINADLKQQQNELEQEEKQQVQVAASLDAKNRSLQGALADVQSATNALQAKYDAEIAAANEDSTRRQLAAEKAALQAAQPVNSGGNIVGGPGGQILPGQVINGFRCPVSGAAYTDDFGGARQHGGIDMFVPQGTPVVAVKAGSVSYVPNEGAGGNAIYLNASDGNTYYYAHQSSFVGGARTVRRARSSATPA